tara:strand:+ start:105 stop:368 length:264 start_codon:yes stop_codon:yes gene_type:complete
MLNELIKIIKVLIILVFFFASINFYFSKNNIKKNIITMNTHEEQAFENLDLLPLIKNDTKDIINYESVDNQKFDKQKKRKFFELFEK